MRFLVPAAGAGLLAVPAIVALYFLKVRRPPLDVPSVLFWGPHLADRQAEAPWQRLRTSLMLLLQVLLAVVLAVALMRPGLTGSTTEAATTVVLIDGSPTMRATDVAPSRFAAAVALARRHARQLGDGQTMAVAVLGSSARLLSPPTADVGALDDALDRARPAGRPAVLEEGISLANAVLAGRPGGSVVLVSDGHFEPPAAPPRVSGSLTYWSVGASGENVGVEAVGRQEDGQVFIRVANVGTEPRSVEVEVRTDGRLVDVLALDVDANASAETTWAGLREGVGTVEARLRPGDAFALDDAGWLVTAPPAGRRALLVTPGNGFLQRALELRDDFEVVVVDPGAVSPEQLRVGAFDLFVFDRYVPPGALPPSSLLVAPPPGSGPLAAAEASDPGAVLPTDPREPLLRYVNLRDVHVQVAARVAARPGWRSIVSATNGPLLLVSEAPDRVALLTFDLHQSDLPLRGAFPVLVQNLVSHLVAGGFENQVFALGEPVPLALAAGVDEVEVAEPDGSRRLMVPPFPPLLEAPARPGIYTVVQRGAQAAGPSRFVVQLPVPERSRIAPGAGPALEDDAVRATRRPEPVRRESTREIWPWLAAAALAALGAEWALFLRR